MDKSGALEDIQNLTSCSKFNFVSIKEEPPEEMRSESDLIHFENSEIQFQVNSEDNQQVNSARPLDTLKQESEEDLCNKVKNEVYDTYEIQGDVPIKSEPPEELTIELNPDQVEQTVRSVSPKHETSDQQQGEFFCQLCNKKFSRKCGLVSHMLIHEGVKPFQCQVCQKAFIHNYQLTKHARIHSGERPYSCDICGKRFLHNDVARHKRVHHYTRELQREQKPYGCPYCGRSFTQHSALQSHQKMHLGVKDQVCHLCGKAFTEHSGLVRHYKTHSGMKDLLCAECGKQFSNKTCLRIHSRVHTHERPYKCRECNKTFSQNSALYYHKRIHSGLKPFECNVCHRTFHVKHNLKTHMVRHGGDRKFRCRLCPKAFALAQEPGTLHSAKTSGFENENEELAVAVAVEGITPSRTSEAPRRKKARTDPKSASTRAKEENQAMLLEAFDILKCSVTTPTDPYFTYGQHIANKLRKYDPSTLAQVKHEINNVIFEADMGKYSYGYYTQNYSQS